MKKLPHTSFCQCLASVRCQQTKLFFQVFSRDSFHHFHHQPWETHTPSPSPTASQTIHRSCSKANLVHTTNRSDCRHDLRRSVRHDRGLAENRIGLAENQRRRRKNKRKEKRKKRKNKCVSSGLLTRRVKNPLVIGYQNPFSRIGNSFLILF